MTAIDFLDDLISKEDSKRTRRQLIAVKKWVLGGCVGTVEWPTGVGKTRIATTAIQVMRRSDPARQFLVVVPRVPLKAQWEKGLTDAGLAEHFKVVVINGLVRKKAKIKTELLILDRFCPVLNLLNCGELLKFQLPSALQRCDHGVTNHHRKVKRLKIEQSAAKYLV